MDLRGKEPIQKGSYDVIVVGGGIAGVAASAAASRAGAKTLILEKSVNLGGLATGGLISLYEPLCDGKGTQMIYGISEELIHLSTCCGFDNLNKRWGGTGANTPQSNRYTTRYSPCVYALLLDDFLLKNGVEIRFDSLVTYPVIEDGRCHGVVVEDANGREYFEAGAVVDATGDASIAQRAGMPTVTGKNYMTYVVHSFDMDSVSTLKETNDICAFRRWMSIGADLSGKGHPEDVKTFTEYSAEEITEYMLIGKQKMLKKLQTLEKNSFDVMSIPTMPQFRTIRRIVGKADFNAVDGETFEDAIGWCGDFRPFGVGKHYQIPFGSMFHEKFENLVVAGRIISAPQGDGWEVSRVIPVCAQTGEAAGKAAALCARQQLSMNDIQRNHMNQIVI